VRLFSSAVLFTPNFSFDEGSSRANELGAIVENVPFFRRIKWFWKNLKDCVNSDKTDRIAGRPSTPFNRFAAIVGEFFCHETLLRYSVAICKKMATKFRSIFFLGSEGGPRVAAKPVDIALRRSCASIPVDSRSAERIFEKSWQIKIHGTRTRVRPRRIASCPSKTTCIFDLFCVENGASGKIVVKSLVSEYLLTYICA